jgi:FixJ family two-component response regulator
VVDDDAAYLRAACRMLSVAGFEVRGFASAVELMACVTPSARGCVLVDLVMPGMDGLELLQALTKTGANMPVIFITARGDVRSAVRAMSLGALDFIEKDAPAEQLLGAVRLALERDAATYAARTHLASLRQRFSMLSDRESEVLGHVLRGRLNKEIAAELDINERTVKFHRTSITTKLGVQSVAELTKLVYEADLMETLLASASPEGRKHD